MTLTSPYAFILRDPSPRLGPVDPTPARGTLASWSHLPGDDDRELCAHLKPTHEGPELRVMCAATGALCAPPMLVLDETLPREGPTAEEEAEVYARMPLTARVAVPLPVALAVVDEVVRMAQEAAQQRRLGPIQALSPEAIELLRANGIDPDDALASIRRHAARGVTLMKFAVFPRVDEGLLTSRQGATAPMTTSEIALRAQRFTEPAFRVDRWVWFPA
jgi:hypothetical protein